MKVGWKVSSGRGKSEWSLGHDDEVEGRKYIHGEALLDSCQRSLLDAVSQYYGPVIGSMLVQQLCYVTNSSFDLLTPNLSVAFS